ncbi:LysM peptidoglycan-binding domain-containing protein [Microbacterium sp. SL62]|uniref:LysM peptidoglycan-binding domain-containing protein n=1 Tax=Microbacterium sp. SL62 TaxID=2995139 RepID=UPI0022739549|nr:LysM peptidoglycan-binding domain-containing protein [Microbacterium sp. SL62]MCY1718535.1 LysM peptidoglycan-binding domain-containing protein [Microbacterium sp. SL62]
MTEDYSEGESANRRLPAFAIGAVAIAFAALLAVGGVGALNALANVPVAAAAPPAPTGVETPVADPSSPPDRDSDPTAVAPREDTVYVIERGDTLTSISAKLGVSVDAIAEYNAVKDVDVISEGAALRTPFIYVPPVTAQ